MKTFKLRETQLAMIGLALRLVVRRGVPRVREHGEARLLLRRGRRPPGK